MPIRKVIAFLELRGGATGSKSELSRRRRASGAGTEIDRMRPPVGVVEDAEGLALSELQAGTARF